MISGLVALAFAAVALRWQSGRLGTNALASLRRFEHVPELGAYRHGLPLVGTDGARAKHAVLLVHGYSAGPSTFDHLAPELRARRILHYGPALTGFGLDSLELLGAVRPQDWQRDVRNAYDLLAGLADEVSVVGVSFGGLLAWDLATRVPVRHLVLISPYHAPGSPRERAIRRALQIPALARALSWLLPVYRKPQRPGRPTNTDILDEEAARRAFHYEALPLASLAAMTRVADAQSYDRTRARQVTVLEGAHDETSDIPAFLATLDANGIPYRTRRFARSDHGLLEDHERLDVCQHVADVLDAEPEGDPPPP
jgi:esterase/lipase